MGDDGAAIARRIADLVDDDDPEDIAFVRRLITSFLDRAPGMLVDLESAATAGDADLTARRAHALKGAAANLGADTLAGRCALIEHLSEDSTDDLARHTAGLSGDVSRAGVLLREARDALSPAGAVDPPTARPVAPPGR
jgi:HPt (histidine-containing phosphotransfer) domain-containing protein